jgi:hypothetical protein
VLAYEYGKNGEIDKAKEIRSDLGLSSGEKMNKGFMKNKR